jgi:AmmeMemoRadiSam system protein B
MQPHSGMRAITEFHSCAELIQYATSGHVSGDKSQGVGYAGMVVSR